MSIGSALLAGTAGLRANASAMAAVSDNIANVNTVGYKRLRNDFSAMLNNQSHQTTYNAGAVRSASTALMTEQGTLQASSVSTHMAISGEGYFVTRERAADATSSDNFNFTRAGQFNPDSGGYLQNTGGQYLYGWPVGTNGTVSASPTDLTALEPIRVTGFGGVAEASTNLAITANLNSDQTVTAPGYVVGDMAAGTVTPDFTTPLEVYDSQGGRHTVNFSFVKTVNPNEWQVEAYVSPSTDIEGATDGLLSSGTVTFTASGLIDPANSTFDPQGALAIGASADAAGIRWATGLGIDAQSIQLNLGDGTSTNGLTQYASDSILDTSSVDGVPFGSLAAVDVDEDGFVIAQYTNGLSRKIYQVPVATFDNEGGLIAQAGSSFRAGPETGDMNLRAPKAAEAGTVVSSALETSTVDLAEEFSNLIVTQRAYSASSKIITTADEMLDELIRIKR
ncbi:flagellar hook protein FlgE [Hirschia maritima]|uniref:flagellar hook protein FlgE n=1 Tax=Hirschia maritima TaxID=1121961 RepID=UPI00038283DC|nr:flagellar hook protein FlgE [Hirschia maritima]